MKILHFSHQNSLEWRIVKAAITSKNRGHEVFFAGSMVEGKKREDSFIQNVFSKTFGTHWTPKAKMGLPYYWDRVKKQIKQIVEEIRPDIVHAHDVFPAKMVSELKVPFVYDNWEHWSQYAKVILETRSSEQSRNRNGVWTKLLNLQRKMLTQLAYARAIKLWTKWDKELAYSAPTITVSEQIAEDLKNLGKVKKIFVVPNFPLKAETADFAKPLWHEKLSSVYAGSDRKNRQVTNRDISGLIDVFAKNDIGTLTIIGWEPEIFENVRATGFLTRDLMYKELFNHSIGLVPFKKHWSHYFLNPNKAYEYAHAGLFVMLTSDLTPVIETLQDNCLTFEDYDDMVVNIRYFMDNMDELYKKRVKIFDHARANLVWENYEDNIMEAYRLA